MLKERMFLSNYTRLGGLFRIKETGRSIHTSYRRDYNTPDKIQLLHTSLAIRRTRLLNINLPIFFHLIIFPTVLNGYRLNGRAKYSTDSIETTLCPNKRPPFLNNSVKN